MKDRIYTIPVNEAFDKHSECPLCTLAKKLEDEAVEYAIGAAMMEPDYRVLSNEKGYCNKHFGLMYKKPNKLSLALVLETHLDELKSELKTIKDAAGIAMTEKTSIFCRKKNDGVFGALSLMKSTLSSCVVCEKIHSTMERYVRVLFWMWENDDEFKMKMKMSKGFCLEHFVVLLENAKIHLGSKKYKEFCVMLCEKEENELNRVAQDVHNFTLKFDYRNHSSEWGTEKDGPLRGVEKIAGYIIKDSK